ncbi:hypothetical protein EVAR_84480_1 [Eumeta japonica]|uniref:Uncharacterized protein n=1 Tax=Eumeta variegata TaxID=151549 RepID=A0A4C1XA92_EUMVA|nr:hypothetical protein EVAR_84480_1 [Eumeta japonica]
MHLFRPDILRCINFIKVIATDRQGIVRTATAATGATLRRRALPRRHDGVGPSAVRGGRALSGRRSLRETGAKTSANERKAPGLRAKSAQCGGAAAAAAAWPIYFLIAKKERRHSRKTCPPVKLCNVEIPQADDAKYLGMHLDRRLTWRKIYGQKETTGLQTWRHVLAHWTKSQLSDAIVPNPHWVNMEDMRTSLYAMMDFAKSTTLGLY